MITVVEHPHKFHVIQSLPKGIKWIGRCYSNNILSQITAFHNEGSHRKMIIHAENAGPHVAKCVMEYMELNSLKSVPHLPYSPDLAPSDFCLFANVKHQLHGHEFTEGVELVSAISEILNQIPSDSMFHVFDDWMRRLQQCFDVRREYVE
jgi:histone-lysine N-methyltransferase SETMAR